MKKFFARLFANVATAIVVKGLQDEDVREHLGNMIEGVTETEHFARSVNDIAYQAAEEYGDSRAFERTLERTVEEAIDGLRLEDKIEREVEEEVDRVLNDIDQHPGFADGVGEVVSEMMKDNEHRAEWLLDPMPKPVVIMAKVAPVASINMVPVPSPLH